MLVDECLASLETLLDMLTALKLSFTVLEKVDVLLNGNSASVNGSSGVGSTVS